MPLDHTILQGPRQPFSALSTLAKADAFVAQQREQEAAAANERRQQLINRVVQESPNDPDAAIAKLRPIDWQAAMSLEKLVTEQRTKQVEMRGKELENLFKAGQVSKQQVEAENQALHSQALEDWVALYEIDPKGAAEKARFMLGPEKLAQLEGQAAQRAETARANQADEAAALSGQALTARGQDLSAQTARAGQAVTARGQDISAATQRRGQDLSAETTRRGQDIKPATAGAKAGPDVAKIMAEIETLSKRINTTGSGPLSVVEGALRRVRAGAQWDNDVSEYNSLVEGMIPMIARAVGHTGVLTQQDVDSVRALFPKLGDNKVLAENKMKRVKSLIAGATPDAAAPAAPAGGKYKVEVVP